MHKYRVQISIQVYSGKPRTITDLKEDIQEEMRAGDESHFSLCVEERHGQLRAASQEMHGAEWWSSRANALEYTRTGETLPSFGIILRI